MLCSCEFYSLKGPCELYSIKSTGEFSSGALRFFFLVQGNLLVVEIHFILGAFRSQILLLEVLLVQGILKHVLLT